MIPRRTTPRPRALWTQLPSARLKALHAEPPPKGNGKAGSKSFTPSKSFARSRKPVTRISPEKAKSDRLYNAEVKTWLQEPGNMWCRVELALTGIPVRATCNHHIIGRAGTLKFDKRFWCPTSFKRNNWPHENIEKARELGLIAKRGEWNNPPKDAETERIKTWMQEQGIWRGRN